MEAYQQRVVDEKRELDGKMSRLASFIGSASFCGVPPEERDRLKLQLASMRSYSEILGQRVAAFSQPACLH